MGRMYTNEYHEHESGNDYLHEEHIHEIKRLYDMLNTTSTTLYDRCCERHSKLSLATQFIKM